MTDTKATPVIDWKEIRRQCPRAWNALIGHPDQILAYHKDTDEPLHYMQAYGGNDFHAYDLLNFFDTNRTYILASINDEFTTQELGGRIWSYEILDKHRILRESGGQYNDRHEAMTAAMTVAFYLLEEELTNVEKANQDQTA